jgi:murein DD-endopeptidase MepM/ murein hydrolase activator NlpD
LAVEEQIMRRRRFNAQPSWSLLITIVFVIGAAASGVGSQALAEQPPANESATEESATEESGVIPQLDPALLASASTAGERAAVDIRTRIRELAQARIDVATSENAAAQDQLDRAAAALEQRLFTIQQQGSELDQMQFTHCQIVGEYEAARRTLGRHVAFLYTLNPDVIIANDFLKTGDVNEAASRQTMIRAVLADDRRSLLETYLAATSSNPNISERAADVREQVDAVDGLVSYAEIAASVQAAEIDDFEAVAALASDWIFPVVGDHNFVDSFLAPRMTGSRYAHRHQGTDVFAERDTPLVAVERGIIGRVGDVNLGGLRVWLLGESGTNYYYAHLSGFAEGLEPGQFVEAGTVLGFVGTTGNAVGTPPHVHFQIHPNGGSAVNPYPLLAQISEG